MRILSVTSGKGGVGKTAVSANLGIRLAERGWRTAILDCDFGLANLALNMGLTPKATLQDVTAGRCSLPEALTEGPAGVQVLAGASGVRDLADLDFPRLRSLARGFEELERSFDFMILDNAAGLSAGVLSVSAAADDVMLVFTPDPSSMMDAYASAKLLFQMKPGARIACVVNAVASEAEARALFGKVHTIARDFLQERIGYAGCVRRDEAMIRAGRRRAPVTVCERNSAAARDFDELANHVCGLPPRAGTTPGFLARLLGRTGEAVA